MEGQRSQKIAFVLWLLLTSELFALPLHTGDLIFRAGEGLFSDIAKNFSPSDKRFSHVGMIFIDRGETFVIHTLDDQTKNFHHTVKEPLSAFLDDALIYAYYRFALTHRQQRKIDGNILRALADPKPFDYRFSLQSPDAYYCTELIFHLLEGVFHHHPVQNRTYRGEQSFISIEDLLKSRGLKPLSHVIMAKK